MIPPTEDDVARELLLKELKQSFPHLMYDAIPIEYTEEGRIKNAEVASELNRFQKKMIYGLEPGKKPVVVANCVNRLGKFSRNSEPVLTSKGWKSIGTIKPGDFIICPDSTKAKVSEIFPQGKVPIVRVYFNDGTFHDCGWEHLWTVKSRVPLREVPNVNKASSTYGEPWIRPAKNRWRVQVQREDFTENSYYDTLEEAQVRSREIQHILFGEEVPAEKGNRLYKQVLTTKEISETLMMRNGKSCNHQIPLITPADLFSSKEELPLEPYKLGLLLGDGGMSVKNAITITSVDKEILSHFEDIISYGNKEITYNLRRNCYKEIKQALLSLGLMEHNSFTKFIPEVYKNHSVQTRLELLRGLMDTDGHISLSKGGTAKDGYTRKPNAAGMEYVSVSKQLAEDVAYLVRSLGGIARLSEKKTSWTYKEIKKYSTAWRVHISLPKSINPFKLQRKAELFELKSNDAPVKTIVKVEEIDFDEATCILVDHPEHLYITNDFIVTHNTFVTALSLILLLIDEHPSVDLTGVKGDIWLLTNSDLLKSEYPKTFFRSPGFLGPEGEYKAQGFRELVDNKGNYHRIEVEFDHEKFLTAIHNKTNGKSIRFFRYTQNWQVLAGKDPLSVYVDEFGDDTKTAKASGANKFTLERFEEIIVRVGSNYMADDRWVFVMMFSLNLGDEDWVTRLIDIGNDKQPIPNATRPGHNYYVDVVTGYKSSDNPFYSKSTMAVASGLMDLMGYGDRIRRRLFDTQGDDPRAVFPSSSRPKKLTPKQTGELLECFRTQPGWELIVSIDPGWGTTAEIFSLVHPVQGVYTIGENYLHRYTAQRAANACLEKEATLFEGREPRYRFFDKHFITRVDQKSGEHQYEDWKAAGCKGIHHYSFEGKSLNKVFELTQQGFWYYDPVNCPNLDKEIKKLKQDEAGNIPENQADHALDACRFTLNYYYKKYYEKFKYFQKENPEQDINPELFEYLQRKDAILKDIALRKAQSKPRNIEITGTNRYKKRFLRDKKEKID